MAVADLSNIPEDYESMMVWSFAHMAHHIDLNAYLARTKTVTLPIFPLDPINPMDLGTWGYQHQVMHNNQNQLLGIKGNDLLDVDWTNQSQRAAWIWLNFTEHLQATNITGVG
jgi:hypothetical protein